MKALGEAFRDISDPTKCVAQCDKADVCLSGVKACAVSPAAKQVYHTAEAEA